MGFWRACGAIVALTLLLGSGQAPASAAQPVFAGASSATGVGIGASSEIDAAALLPAADGAGRVIVLGELHGTNEAPALAAALVQRRLAAGLPVTLALEIHAAEQPRLDAFLAFGDAAAGREALLDGDYWRLPRERSDGRRSAAMLALIEAMREQRANGADLRMLAIDAGNAGAGADERNRRIAGVLRTAIDAAPDRAFVVLIGNYHARRAMPDRVTGLMPGESPPVPTMAHLADVPMLRINVSAAEGEFWACMAGTCGPWPLGGRAVPAPVVATGTTTGAMAQTARFRLTPNDSAGWDAQLVLPRFSVSEPAEPSPQR